MDRWYALNEKMEDFLYGDRGIVTIAYDDRDLNTYTFDVDKVIYILKELKEIYTLQSGFTEYQKKQLDILKNSFLEVYNGKNKVKNWYNQIVNIYKNIEEY